jgi:hypothetical protein
MKTVLIIQHHAVGAPSTHVKFADVEPRIVLTPAVMGQPASPAIPGRGDQPETPARLAIEAKPAVLEADDAFTARMIAEHVTAGHRYVWTTKDALPKDAAGIYIPPNQWVVDWTTGAVTVYVKTLDDLKTDTLKRIRDARAPLLATLDAQFMIAVDTSQPTAPIAAKRQALRDITKLVPQATTQAQLDAIQVSL